MPRRAITVIINYNTPVKRGIVASMPQPVSSEAEELLSWETSHRKDYISDYFVPLCIGPENKDTVETRTAILAMLNIGIQAGLNQIGYDMLLEDLVLKGAIKLRETFQNAIYRGLTSSIIDLPTDLARRMANDYSYNLAHTAGHKYSEESGNPDSQPMIEKIS